MPHRVLFGALHQPRNAIAYDLTEYFEEAVPGQPVLHTGSGSFHLVDLPLPKLAKEGSLALLDAYRGEEEKVGATVVHGWFEVEWEGATLEVVALTYTVESYGERHHWISAATRELAEKFFLAVCQF